MNKKQTVVTDEGAHELTKETRKMKVKDRRSKLGRNAEWEGEKAHEQITLGMQSIQPVGEPFGQSVNREFKK